MMLTTAMLIALGASFFCLLVPLVNSKTVPETIRKRGYKCQEHHVTTKDGYILTMFRISPKSWHLKTPPVIMQHGLLSSAFSWVLSTPHKAPAFLLADAGYDVWLPNVRGSTYSRNHTHFHIKSYDFWNFSWDEMAEFDFPAFIEYVLHTTKYSKLHYIGHSMGSTIYFSGMNYHPELNSKIHSMYAIGPVASVAHIRSEIRVLTYVEGLMKFGMEIIGEYEFLPEDSLMMKLTRFGCDIFKISEWACTNMLFLLTGFDNKAFNPNWLPAVSKELLSGTSINTVIHYGQEYKSGLYRKYDFGYRGNLAKYGQHHPPEYKLNCVTSRVNLIWGDNDYLADVKDVQYLKKYLPNVGSASGAVADPKFNHLDFLWAKEAKKMVYDKIIADMKHH